MIWIWPSNMFLYLLILCEYSWINPSWGKITCTHARWETKPSISPQDLAFPWICLQSNRHDKLIQIITHMIYHKLLDWLQPNPTAKIMLSLSLSFCQPSVTSDSPSLTTKSQNCVPATRTQQNNTIIPSISRTCVCVCLLVPQPLRFPCCKMVFFSYPPLLHSFLGLLLLAHCWISQSSSCTNPRRPVLGGSWAKEKHILQSLKQGVLKSQRI